MSMNVPPNENMQDAAVVDNAAVAPVNEVAAEQEAVAAAPVEGEVAAAPAAQEEQVLTEVAQDLAEDVISSEDIIIAMLMDNFGLSPQGAQSLFQLLMTDMAQDMQAAPVDTSMAAGPQDVTNVPEAPVDTTQLPPEGV